MSDYYLLGSVIDQLFADGYSMEQICSMVDDVANS